MKIIIAMLLISLSSICNATEEVKASISWAGKTCSVPISKITEDQAVQYTSIAAVTKVQAKGYQDKTLEEWYGGKCPLKIGKRDNHIYYELGRVSRSAKVFVFEIVENSVVFVRAEPRGCK